MINRNEKAIVASHVPQKHDTSTLPIRNGIAVIFNAVRHANRLIDENETDKTTRSLAISLSIIKQEIFRMGAVLGIGNDAPVTYFDVQRESVLAQATMDVKLIETLIDERETARQEKNWDAIRATARPCSGIW